MLWVPILHDQEFINTKEQDETGCLYKIQSRFPKWYDPLTRAKTENHTVFPSGYIDILAESRVSDSLEDLEASQDFDWVGGKREAIAPTDIMRQSWGKEGEGS